MRTLLVAVVAALAACGSEQPPAPQSSRPACVAGRQICGLAPPQRVDPDGIAYRITTVTGKSSWVVVPAALPDDVVAVPEAPLRVNASLTTAAPRDAAERFCDGFPSCEPTAVSDERSLVRWDDASGSIRELEVTTLDLGTWTLVLLEPDARRAERVARAITATVDGDGYPRLESAGLDARWAGVLLWVGDHLVHVVRGCKGAAAELELHDPENAAGGTWCEGRYRVDVTFADGPTLELLHEKLRIVPG